jgi:ABC-type polysaccharide/polyol phosphate export permease
MTTAASSHDHLYILRNLVAKDFKVRYRNMSLGILWSLVNPLVMMGVLTFVFTVLFPQLERRNYPLFVLLGLVPYNFFSLSWLTGTGSVAANANLVKRVPFRRELLPVSVVLGNVLHYVIQIALLLSGVLWFVGFNFQWLWIPVIIALQIVFVCGLSLLTSSLDVYYRDVRYVVESATLVLFWLSPVFYGVDRLPEDVRWIYELNPIAAVIFLLRQICLRALRPAATTMLRLVGVSFSTLFVGGWVYRRLKKDFADYL